MYNEELVGSEAELRKVHISWSYADELYQLRVQLQYLRGRCGVQVV